MLKKFNQCNCIFAKVPYHACCYLRKHLGPAISALEYARVIDSLMYLINCTKLNIPYAIGRLNRYTSSPHIEH